MPNTLASLHAARTHAIQKLQDQILKERMDDDAYHQSQGVDSVGRPIAGRFPADLHWGGWCPECGRRDDCLNVKSTHWYCCHTHQTRWCVGSNLFSSWKAEDESVWQRNSALLRTYRSVSGHDSAPWPSEDEY